MPCGALSENWFCGDCKRYHLLPRERYGLADEQSVFSKQIVLNRQSPRLYAALDAIVPRHTQRLADGKNHPGRAGGSGSAKAGNHDDKKGTPQALLLVPVSGPRVDDTIPTPNSVVVSQDRWCLYPPSLGRADRKTLNPGAHLDICPWAYLPRPDRRVGADTDANTLQYTESSWSFDFRAEINAVRGERGGPHCQGVLNLIDNFDEDGGTALVPGFHKVCVVDCVFSTLITTLLAFPSEICDEGAELGWVFIFSCFQV